MAVVSGAQRASYIKSLGEARDAINREMDLAQVGGLPEKVNIIAISTSLAQMTIYRREVEKCEKP